MFIFISDNSGTVVAFRGSVICEKIFQNLPNLVDRKIEEVVWR